MMKNTLPLIDGLSIGEYAAQWGCDSSFDSDANQPGDGELFYQFGQTNDSMAYRSDQEFLEKFLPAIERTLKTVQIQKERHVEEYGGEFDKDLAELTQLRDFVAGLLEFDEFTRSYIECAIWTSEDNRDETGNTRMDAAFTAADLAPDAKAEIIRECKDFQQANAEHLSVRNAESRAGHDFWLTRNRHGAGFWDGDWPEPQATILTSMAKAYGECFLYVGDDNKIHVH